MTKTTEEKLWELAMEVAVDAEQTEKRVRQIGDAAFITLEDSRYKVILSVMDKEGFKSE